MGNHRKQDFPMFVYVLPTAAAVLCYLNGLDGDFVHDDRYAIAENADVTGRAPIHRLFWDDFWGRPMCDNTSHKSYRPLTVLTFRWVRTVVGVFIYYFHTLYIKLRSTAFPSSHWHTHARLTQLTRPYCLFLRYTSNRIITQNYHRRLSVRNQLLLLLFCTTAQAYIIDCNVIFRRQNKSLNNYNMRQMKNRLESSARKYKLLEGERCFAAFGGTRTMQQVT